MIKEFKDFIMRGNVLELAVAVIIAGAFGLVVTSFTNDVIMPPIGMALGGVDFADLQYVLQAASTDADGKEIPAVAIKYGVFINSLINFLIVAFVIFLIVKAYNRTQQPPEETPPAGPSEVDLLMEIRDALKK